MLSTAFWWIFTPFCEFPYIHLITVPPAVPVKAEFPCTAKDKSTLLLLPNYPFFPLKFPA